MDDRDLSQEVLGDIAASLDVSVQDVTDMNMRLKAHDGSLNTIIDASSDNGSEWIDFISDNKPNQGRKTGLQRNDGKLSTSISQKINPTPIIGLQTSKQYDILNSGFDLVISTRCAMKMSLFVSCALLCNVLCHYGSSSLYTCAGLCFFRLRYDCADCTGQITVKCPTDTSKFL